MAFVPQCGVGDCEEAEDVGKAGRIEFGVDIIAEDIVYLDV